MSALGRQKEVISESLRPAWYIKWASGQPELPSLQKKKDAGTLNQPGMAAQEGSSHASLKPWFQLLQVLETKGWCWSISTLLYSKHSLTTDLEEDLSYDLTPDVLIPTLGTSSYRSLTLHPYIILKHWLHRGNAESKKLPLFLELAAPQVYNQSWIQPTPLHSGAALIYLLPEAVSLSLVNMEKMFFPLWMAGSTSREEAETPNGPLQVLVLGPHKNFSFK